MKGIAGCPVISSGSALLPKEPPELRVEDSVDHRVAGRVEEEYPEGCLHQVGVDGVAEEPGGGLKKSSGI